MSARPEPPPTAEELEILRQKLLRRREAVVHEMARIGIDTAALSQLAGCQAGISQIDIALGNTHRPRRWS